MDTRTLVMALPFALLTSCADDDATTIRQTDNEIRIDANVSQMTGNKSLKTGTSFENGDEIAVFAWTGTAESPVNCSTGKYQLNEDGKWYTTTPMYYQDSESSHYFVGVYPAKEITDLTATLVDIDINDKESCDILVATNLNGIVASKNAVPLVFTHIMSRLNINLSYMNFQTTPINVTVSISTATKASVDLVNKTVAGTEVTNVYMPASYDEQGKPTGFSGIVTPMNLQSVYIIIDGTQYTFTASSAIKLTAGHSTTINLNVTKQITEVTAGDISIVDWEEDTPISGEAELDTYHMDIVINGQYCYITARDGYYITSWKESDAIEIYSATKQVRTIMPRKNVWRAITEAQHLYYLALQQEALESRDDIE